ncbi:MAG: fimbrillin family protein [Duncaniella sp.]|nr:fimbrillin family protein [Duncaniella sp.]
MAMTVVGLAACTEQEIPVSATRDGNAIDFRPAMGTRSRATETTNDNLSQFTATSFLGDTNYFTNVNFAKGSDGFFTSVAKYFWPGDKTDLSFYAYSPSEEELTSTGGTIVMEPTTKQLQDFSVAEEIADQVDFITAYATGNKEDNEASGVELTFDHRLAQIEVRAKSDNQQYKFKVTGVRIGRAQYLGTFDFTTNEWTLDDWHDTAVYTSSCDEVTLSSNPVSIMGASGNAMLLPQTLTPWSPTNDPDNVAREAYLSVLVNISTEDGAVIYPFPSDTRKDASGNVRKYAWASVPLSETWEAGKKYIYTLDFTEGAGNVDPDDPTPGEPVLGDPIKFTVKVTDWVDTPVAEDMHPVKKTATSTNN